MRRPILADGRLSLFYVPPTIGMVIVRSRTPAGSKPAPIGLMNLAR